jgi:hypothetical protein
MIGDPDASPDTDAHGVRGHPVLVALHALRRRSGGRSRDLRRRKGFWQIVLRITGQTISRARALDGTFPRGGVLLFRNRREGRRRLEILGIKDLLPDR